MSESLGYGDACPSDAAEVIRGANDLIHRGLLKEASDLLTEGLKGYPDDAPLLRALARLRMLEHRPADAVPLLQRALQVLQSKRTERSAAVSGESPRQVEHDIGNCVANPPSPPPSSQTHASATPTLPDAELDYAAALENEIIKKREYEFGIDPDLQVPLQVSERIEPGEDPTSVERKLSDEATANRCDISVSPKLFRARSFPIEKLLAFAASEQATQHEDDDVPTLEDLYFDEADTENDLEDHGIALDGLTEERQHEAILHSGDPEDSPPLDIEQRSYEPSLDDFGDGLADELPTRDEMRRIPSRLTREERARQVALDLAIEFGWDRAGVQLLTLLFVKHWWGAARVALQREIQAGASPKDISLADALREIWRSYPEFSNHLDYRGQVNQRYTVLPWPTALALVRAFQGYPDEAELESFLVDAYDMWWEDENLKERFDSLYKFIRYRLTAMYENDGLSPWDVFRCETIDLDVRGHLRRIQKLESLGVPVPDWETDLFSEVDLGRSAARKKAEESLTSTFLDLHESNDGGEWESEQEGHL